MKIAVVGAGIVGLSSSVCVQAELPDAEVTIIAELIDEGTTSDGAAGLFHPNHVQAENMFHVDQWIHDSALHYWKLCYSSIAAEVGVFELSGYSLSEGDLSLLEDSIFLKYVRNYRRLEDVELKQFGGGPWREGSFKTSFITEPRKMMAYLFKQFTANRGVVQQRRIESLSELQGHFDIVINCSGLGARQLVGDESLFPVRGQVARVSAPWVKHFFFAGLHTYIIPNSEVVVVGGTYQPHNWSKVVSQEDRGVFFEHACELLPSLKSAKPVRDWAGLRPTRPTVRLELERLQISGDKSLPVVHNYGHGSNGIALSWGCGVHVAKIVHQVAQEMTDSTKTLST